MDTLEKLRSKTVGAKDLKIVGECHESNGRANIVNTEDCSQVPCATIIILIALGIVAYFNARKFRELCEKNTGKYQFRTC